VPQYCAFGIGPEELATSVHEFDARDDAEALEKASPHFHDGLKRVEIWCGSRKVGDVTPQKKLFRLAISFAVPPSHPRRNAHLVRRKCGIWESNSCTQWHLAALL
jgi:hypothetical protein